MTAQQQTIQSKRLPILCFLTAVAMIYSSYTHLDFVAQGIQNLRIEDFFVAWPIWFLFVSIPMLTISALIGLHTPQTAAKLAFVATIIGWGYYGFALLMLLVPILFFFWKPDVILNLLVPCVLLFMTTITARRVSRSIT